MADNICRPDSHWTCVAVLREAGVQVQVKFTIRDRLTFTNFCQQTYRKLAFWAKFEQIWMKYLESPIRSRPQHKKRVKTRETRNVIFCGQHPPRKGSSLLLKTTCNAFDKSCCTSLLSPSTILDACVLLSTNQTQKFNVEKTLRTHYRRNGGHSDTQTLLKLSKNHVEKIILCP